MRPKSLALALSLLLFMPIPAVADDVITIDLTRSPHPDFTFSGTLEQSYILVTAGPIPPTICYVLSPGGAGRLFVAVSGNRLGVNSVNFLVRTRHLLAGAAQLLTGDNNAEQGSCVAVLDAATDFLFGTLQDGSQPGLRGFRLSDERFLDIAAVIADLRRGDMFGNNIRIVLDGTSRGTIDMAEYAARAGAGPVDEPVDALVLSSTLTVEQNPPDNVFNSDLSEVRVPTLLLFHEDDACFVTPPEDVELVKAQLVNAPRIRVRGFKGGFPPVNPIDCQATTFHGFLGKEADVVRAITRWVSQVLR